ncbi:uncharacterized protein LOC113287559 isoform X2 [Papaver somniferum]|nr:uncharacterized protein LOC113287559 isoform X2 [Papaver somniferum]
MVINFIIVLPSADILLWIVLMVGELSGGWPLGLENMNIRLEIVDNFQISREPYTSQPRSTSFSSFTSSELDTESTRSSFQDPSVSLGRLLGMKPRQGEDFHFEDLTRLEETHGMLSTATKSAMKWTCHKGSAFRSS